MSTLIPSSMLQRGDYLTIAGEPYRVVECRYGDAEIEPVGKVRWALVRALWAIRSLVARGRS